MASTTNIVGNPLNNTAYTQLQQRSKALAQTEIRTPDQIKFYANSNAWIKVTSLIDLAPNEYLKQKFGATGNNLAKQWVLLGGVASNSPAGYRAGLNAYEIGKNPLQELGYRPMPGVTSVNIQTIGKGGSLRTGDVKIRANNLEQLDVLDTLFFKLGYPCLVEWGHVQYLDNSGKLVMFDSTETINAFSSGISKQKILQELESLRYKHSGNYDGMLGVISNYSWEAVEDGSYNCTLKLTGIGSIADSLKINNTTGGSVTGSFQNFLPPLSTPSSLSSNFGTFPTPWILAQAQPPTSGLESVLQDIKTGVTRVAGLVRKDQPVFSLTFDQLAISIGADYLSSVGFGMFPTSKEIKTYNPTDPVKNNFAYGFNAGVLANPSLKADPNIGRVNFEFLENIMVVRESQNVDPNKTPTSEIKAYIKLGLFLAIINNASLIYEQDQDNRDTKRPVTYIDFHPETNLCYTNALQISTRPDICIVQPSSNFVSVLDGLLKQEQFSQATVDKIYTDANALDFVPENVNQNLLLASDGFRSNTSDNQGKVMNIYLSLDYLITTLKSLEANDTNANVDLNTLLKKILQDVQLSLGNVNQFSVGHDDTANCIRIYDAQCLSKETYKPLPVFGLTSTALSLNISSETSTKLGSALGISAQAAAANQTSQANTNLDTTSLALLNKNIIDRTAGQKVTDPSKNSTPDDNKQQISQATVFIRYLANYYKPFINPAFKTPATLNTGDQQSVVNFYAGAMTRIKKDTTLSPVTANIVMPIACNIAFNGISTFVLWEAFTLPPNRLPSQYLDDLGRPRIAFTTGGIDHTIENNVWTTKIRGLMINVLEGQTTSKSPKVNTVKNIVGCSTSYKNLPVQPSTGTSTLSFKEAKTYLSKYGTLGRNVFLIIYNESRHNTAGFYTGMGGHNFAGVQTDSGRWNSGDELFSYQFCIRDSGEVPRMFAGFASNKDFLEFMVGRARAKGFSNLTTPEAFADLYLNTWVFSNLKTSSKPITYKKKNYATGTALYNELLPGKTSIAKTAEKIWNSV